MLGESGLSAVERGQHPGAVHSQGKGVLEMGGLAAVAGDHRPLVLGEVGLLAAEGHHRLHGQRQTLDQLGAAAGSADVRDVRRLVHLGADAVADVVLEDAVVALAADVALDRVGDVGEPAAEARGGDAGPQRVLGDLQQAAYVVGDGVRTAHRDGDGGVAVPAVHDGAAVEADDVALDEHPLPRDAVHDLVVDRRTDRARERRVPVAQERRHAAVRADVLLGDPVEVTGGDAGPHRRAHQLEALADEPAGDAHLVDLVAALDLDAALAQMHQASQPAKPQPPESSVAHLGLHDERSERQRASRGGRPRVMARRTCERSEPMTRG